MALLFAPAEHGNSGDYSEIARTAECLRLSEFNLFRLAYRRWYGRECETRMLERIFGNYLTSGMAPHWVRHLARNAVGDGHDRERFAAGDLPRHDGLPAAPFSPYPALLFLAALVIYGMLLT